MHTVRTVDIRMTWEHWSMAHWSSRTTRRGRDMGSDGLKKKSRRAMSEETKAKIGKANSRPYLYMCDWCGEMARTRPSHYRKKIKHFCSQECYTEYKKTIPSEMNPRWDGGVSDTESHRRWKRKNPERLAHLKARRYALKKGAKGSHTFEEWEEMKKRYNYKCAECLEEKKLTKDHIMPLSEGGSDYIANIQPLCRNCNSKKWKKIPQIIKSSEVF